MTTATFLLRRSKSASLRKVTKNVLAYLVSMIAAIFNRGKIFFIASFILFCLFSALYVYQVNRLTKNYYLMDRYEQTVKEMAQENRDLQVTFASAGMMRDIAVKVNDLQFTAQGQVRYLYIFDNTLAAAQNEKF